MGKVFIEDRTPAPKVLEDGTVVAAPPKFRLKWRDPNKRDQHGKPVQESVTFDDHDDATVFANLVEAENFSLADAAATAKAISEKIPTVAEMICDHITHLTGIEESTRQDYRRMVDNHITPVIGGIPANTLDRKRVKRWVNQVSRPDPVRAGAALMAARKDADLDRDQLARQLGWTAKRIAGYETGREPLGEEELAAVSVALKMPRVRRLLLKSVAFGMGAKTLRNVHSLLSAAFTWAIVENKLRDDNPAKSIKLPEYTPAEMNFLTRAEFWILLTHFREPYQLMVRVLAGTGMRWGELIALTVGDINLDAELPYVSINKAVKPRPGGHYIGAPKSSKSRRLVALPASLVPPLRILIGDRDNDTPLFRGPRGGRVHYTNFYEDQWVPAIAAATATDDADGRAVPRDRRLTKKRVRIHDLRHSHASWLIARRIDLATVQRRLGHESIVTTVDRYGHLDPTQLAAAAHAADSVLAGFGVPPDPLPDVLAPVVDLEAERRARAGASVHTDTGVDHGTDADVAVAVEALTRPPAVTAWTAGPGAADLSEERARTVLGDQLRRIRTTCGWTQKELVDRLPFDLHTTTLVGYERGTVQCTTTRFMQLCTAMGADPAQALELVMQRITGDPDAVREDAPPLSEERAGQVLGDQLRRIRATCGLSQQQLVERLPFTLHRSTLRGYENGTIKVTTTRFLQLCMAMGAAPGQVMDHTNQRIAGVLPTPAAMDAEVAG